MKYFIFRNQTIEPFFNFSDISFSGYTDISIIEEADRYIWFYLPSYKSNEKIVHQEILSYLELLKIVLPQIKSNRMILIFSMQLIYKVNFQTCSFVLENTIEHYNKEIYKLISQYPNIKILNISDFYSRIDIRDAIDWKFYYIYQMPLNPKFITRFNTWFVNQIEAIEFRRKKCIVLDLDNTLWGGIIGEDGINGIKIGETYPGNAYVDFQRFLLDLSNNGIILTICSKNNEQDILDAWNENPDLVLKKEHFAAYKINWDDKVDNIKAIAKELNIGLDSMVFIDDSPSERELVKQMLPMVDVPDFPEYPYLYLEFIRNLVDQYFRIYMLTIEDVLKTRQYRDNADRHQSESSFVNYDDYLKSLEILLSIEHLSDSNIARFAQMTQKTNQFNLTTKRYTENDITTLKSEGAELYGVRVTDKFGDNGLTGLLIAKLTGQIVVFDTLLLSCRILGKGIEYEFVKYIISKLKQNGVSKIMASYIKTQKNTQVSSFYDKLGFVLIREDSAIGEKIYMLDTNQFEYTESEIYKIRDI
jgi:FkbH-like protein